MYNKRFQAFLEEAQFTKEILSIGVTQIRKANYATQGIYFQSFTCLSVGIERACKLILILDYYVNNNGKSSMQAQRSIRLKDCSPTCFAING